jgi:hypothetical protein
MQIRIKVEVFGDNPPYEIKTDSTTMPFAEGIIVGDLNLPKGKPVSVRMRNILAGVQDTITKDSTYEGLAPEN